jgi:hypothetical protein
VARTGPPAYAWDWFSRQRLLWREARARLAAQSDPVARRYAMIESRADVLAMLRADYPRDDAVRNAVNEVVATLAFGDRTDTAFAALGFHNPPRGLRWWWTALTGEDLDRLSAALPPKVAPPSQPTLDDVLRGYGD